MKALVIKMREFSILIYEAPDIPGQWLAHCLNWDVVSHDHSPEKALYSLQEALTVVIEEDQKSGLDSASRRPAPDADWHLYQRVRGEGEMHKADRMGALPLSPGLVIAGTLYLKANDVSVSDHVPLPFIIQAMEQRASA